ncbi:MAG TPA: response regulator [Thermoanaerobaculia bacterium]|nr:response regulator [Thermoanaerobaculia bacterium]
MRATKEILIVEDDYSFRWALAIGLQRRNVDADIAENGAEAMELLGRFDYRAVVLDLKLPKIGGEEIVQRLAESSQRPAVSIVTAYPEVAERMKSEKSGVVRRTYVKPVDVRTLVDDLMGDLTAA